MTGPVLSDADLRAAGYRQPRPTATDRRVALRALALTDGHVWMTAVPPREDLHVDPAPPADDAAEAGAP